MNPVKYAAAAFAAVVASAAIAIASPEAAALSSGGSTATRALNNVQVGAPAPAQQAAPVQEAPAKVVATVPLDTDKMAATVAADSVYDSAYDWTYLRNAGVAFPGAKISTGTIACTTGYVVERGGKDYILTAGHCGEVGSTWGVRDGQGKLIHVGTMAERQLDSAKGVDWSLIAVENGALVSPDMPLDTPVGRVMNTAEAANADAICVLGQVSGLSCGAFQSVSASGRLVFESISTHGDSGAPVFALKDGVVHPVGILEGGYPNSKNLSALPLDSIIQSLNLSKVKL